MNQLLARRRRLMSMAQPEDPYLTQPFTMVFQVNRSITLSAANDSNYTALTSLKYNKNNTGWVNVDLSSSRTLSFSTGDSVQWIGNGAWRVDDSGNGFHISGSFLSAVGNKGICSLEGNLLSLFGGDNFTSMTSIPDYAFYGGLELITDDVAGNYSYFVGDITNLRIPATTIGNYSLYCVFYMECMRQGDATNLFPNLTTVGNYGLHMAFGVDSNPYAFSNEFKPPILKATTLGEGAYDGMFHYSKSMTTAPSLPATTLANYCYRRMFYGCTSITTAPSLPATTLTNGCYDRMFQGCTALVTAPTLPATTLADYCYRNMFYGCTKLTTAPTTLPATTLASRCYSSMFYNCTKLTTAPTTLPATTLADYCYQRMFFGCTKLTTAPTTLPATTLAYACYDSMYSNTNFLPDTTNIDFTSQSAVQNGYLIGLFAGTKITDSQLRNILPLSNGRACLPVTVLSNNCYQNMFSGCKALTTAPDLPATTLADYCYQNMFQNCTALTTPPTLSATTLANSCCASMFQNCTALVTAPALPATKLVSRCYQSMFQGCSNLNYIKAMFTTTPSTLYTSSWVSGVASSGTFVKNSAATWTTTGNNGVPSNWTIQTASS